jgi:flagellar motor component MotA
MAQMRVRPSKPASIMGVVIGAAFIVIGITMSRQTFADAKAPWFGKFFVILWTVMAAAIFTYHATNLIRRRGVADRIVDTDQPDSPLGRTENRLKELSDLRAKNLITEEEFQNRRTQILNEV